MKTHLKEIVVFVLFILIFIWATTFSFKYYKLKTEHYNQQIETTTIIDSLEKNIKEKEIIIGQLEDKIVQLDDSINKVKVKKIYIKNETFTISKNISESSLLLKNNLSCVEL